VKAATLLDRLADEPEISATRLAALIGEPRSTVYRLLASLQRLELVEPGVGRGTYRLGLKLFRLGSSVVARFDERQAALPVMERIHEETGETVFLCVRRGSEAVCIERLDGRRVQSLALRLGGSLPLHVGAAPAVLLAFQPKEAWQAYVDSVTFDPLTSKTVTNADELLDLLREIRRLGYSISDEDVTPGIAAIGAPVFDYQGTIRAALSISGLRPAILGDHLQQVRDLAVVGAQDISRALGYDAGAAASHG
jgi:DNA-binding IclR family transcriptional regulator